MVMPFMMRPDSLVIFGSRKMMPLTTDLLLEIKKSHIVPCRVNKDAAALLKCLDSPNTAIHITQCETAHCRGARSSW